MKKKAMEFPFARFGVIIVLLLFIIAISPLMKSILNFITGQGNTASCAVALTTGDDIYEACSLDKVIIYDDKVEINDEVWMKKGSGTTNEMVKEALAKMLQTCLSKGGGYNSRAFKPQGYYDSNWVCMECFHVTIDESVQEDVTELTDYIKENKPKGSDKTYLEILTKDEDHLKNYILLGEDINDYYSIVVSPYLHETYKDLTFNSNQDYTVFFIAFKQKRYYSLISKTSDIGKICEVKVN